MVVIPEDPTSFSIFDYSLKEISHVKPDTLFGYNKMRSQKTSGVPKDRHEILEVYDVCYIPFRDLYCYCSSDHTIIMMKPHTDSTGKKFHYSLYNKIQHGYRHVKLCWSESCRVLCSVSAVNDIFGWTVDGKTPVFQVSRHKEMITDFLALEDVGLFATCSLDKRIVLWSQSTQRVRGVLIGHERGIRVMSYAKNTLVTAGFEMDIKVWNVSLQENSLILRGHRAPISAVKIMCQPKAHDLEMRTLSVDDRGEFRLWDIRVKAGTDVKVVNSMHTFNMNDAHLSQVRFLAVPYETKFSRESYSNFICASSKLVRFKPEKVCKDFLPCSEMMYSRGNNALLLSVGRSLFKYDIISGVFQNCISNVDKTEIASMCADDRHRIYVGCTNGDVLLLKFSTGQILSSIRAHQHSVTALSLVQMGNGSNMIFSGSMGGTLRTIDDTCGNLAINNTAGKAFKNNLSIALIRNIKDAKVFIAASNDTKWGVWTDVTLKNLLTFKEESKVIDLVEIAPQNTSDTFGRGMGTVVVCTEQYLKIYALDFKHLDFHITHVLGNTNTFVKRSYLSAIILKCPPNSVNYAESEDVEYSDTTLLAGCDDGYLVGWDAKEFRDESIKSYFTVKPAYSEAYMKQKKQLDHEAAMKRQSKRLKKEAAMAVALTPTKLLDDNLADDEDSDYSDCSSESDDIFAGDGEVDDDSSLFSLTSKVGLLNVNTAGGVNVQRMAHTVRCDAEGNPKHDVLLPPAVESFDTHIPTSPPKGRRAMLLKHDTFSFNYTKSASFQYSTTRPCVCWKGHEGAISTLIGLDEHGCLVTSGVDGFQRIWNLQMKCLGIMLLPNITEEMKEYYRQNVVKYSFIMESIKITKMHEKLALRLSDIIIKECDDTEVKAKSNFRRHGTMGKNMGVAAKEHAVQKVSENATEQDILRGGLLKVVTTDYIREESHDDVSDDTTKDQSNVKFVKDDYQSPTVDTRPNTSPASFSSVGTVTLTHFPPAAGATLGEGKNDINSVISMRPGTCPSLQPVQDGSSTCSMTSLTTKSSFSCSSAANLARVRRAAAAQHAKGIYGTKELWVNSESMMDKQCGLTAFSEKSVMKSMGDGLIDHEGHMCLRQVKKDAVKVKAYDRAVEKLMLKNCRQSTSVRIAAATAVKPPEIMFGAQKVCHLNFIIIFYRSEVHELTFAVVFFFLQNMYGNANSLINSKRAKTSASDRHHMAMTMIKNSTRRHEGEMVHSVDPLQAFSDNIVIPGLDSQDVDTEAGTTSQANPAAPKEVTALPRSRTAGRRSGIVDMTISTEPPVTKGRDSKVLDRVRMASWIQKVTEAEEGAIPEWEARENKRREEADRKNKRKARKDNVAHNHHVMKMLENKLTKSVIAFHAALGNEDPNKVVEARPVTTRDLLPYYRAADFKSFFNVYLCVDEEFKGEIDVNQWVFFFSKMKKTVSKKTAYLLFTDLDKDADGKLTVEDLIEFMFSKANQKQMELMKSHIMKVIRKNQAVGHLGVTEAELNQIFDYYDEDFVGYIKVRSLKDRLKSFNLPSPASASIYTKIRDLYDDDMISLIEFVRLFKPYLIVDHIQ